MVFRLWGSSHFVSLALWLSSSAGSVHFLEAFSLSNASGCASAVSNGSSVCSYALKLSYDLCFEFIKTPLAAFFLRRWGFFSPIIHNTTITFFEALSSSLSTPHSLATSILLDSSYLTHLYSSERNRYYERERVSNVVQVVDSVPDGVPLKGFGFTGVATLGISFLTQFPHHPPNPIWVQPVACSC